MECGFARCPLPLRHYATGADFLEMPLFCAGAQSKRDHNAIILTIFLRESMRTLICGSIAYDTIMVFRDQFKNHILPDQLHILIRRIPGAHMRREFGGCAATCLQSENAGRETADHGHGRHDYQPYAYRLDKLQLSQQSIRKIPDNLYAQAFITTDLDDNQIRLSIPAR